MFLPLRFCENESKCRWLFFARPSIVCPIVFNLKVVRFQSNSNRMSTSPRQVFDLMWSSKLIVANKKQFEFTSGFVTEYKISLRTRYQGSSSFTFDSTYFFCMCPIWLPTFITFLHIVSGTRIQTHNLSVASLPPLNHNTTAPHLKIQPILF